MEEAKALEILSRLRQNKHIPLHKWGTGSYKTLGDFFNEMRAEEAVVDTEHYSGYIHRYIRVLLLDVFYKDFSSGKSYHLVQKSQTFTDGRPRPCKSRCSVSEKLRHDEKADGTTIARALNEELGITGNTIFRFQDEFAPGARESTSYPGIITCGHYWKFRVFLFRFQFDPKGYKETRDDITTVFEWEECDPIDIMRIIKKSG